MQLSLPHSAAAGAPGDAASTATMVQHNMPPNAEARASELLRHARATAKYYGTCIIENALTYTKHYGTCTVVVPNIHLLIILVAIPYRIGVIYQMFICIIYG